MTESQHLELVDTAGTAISAVVVISEREDEFDVRIHWPEREVSASGTDAFTALCAARERLSAYGLTPKCYGACRNLVVSAMASQMGGGLAGYLVRLGQQARMSDLVQIFDTGPDMDLVSVLEQQEFRLAWFRSVGIPG